MSRKTLLQLIAIACFLTIAFTSCTKDPVVEPGPAPANAKLSKIEYGDGSYQSITYHTNGTVNKIVVFTKYGGNNSLTEKFDFVYVGNLLSEIRLDNGTKYKYTYNNGQVVKIEFINSTGIQVGHYDYTYKNGQLWQTDGYFFTGGNLPANPYLRYAYEYYANGNIQKMTTYYHDPVSNQLEKSDEFVMDEYDTKQNTTVLFESNPYLPLANFTPNNPLKELHYDGAAFLEETIIHSYTYDAAGKPVTRKSITKIPGQADKQETATFYY